MEGHWKKKRRDLLGPCIKDVVWCLFRENAAKEVDRFCYQITLCPTGLITC
jgi:hypothetical protein